MTKEGRLTVKEWARKLFPYEPSKRDFSELELRYATFRVFLQRILENGTNPAETAEAFERLLKAVKPTKYLFGSAPEGNPPAIDPHCFGLELIPLMMACWYAYRLDSAKLGRSAKRGQSWLMGLFRKKSGSQSCQS